MIILFFPSLLREFHTFITVPWTIGITFPLFWCYLSHFLLYFTSFHRIKLRLISRLYWPKDCLDFTSRILKAAVIELMRVKFIKSILSSSSLYGCYLCLDVCFLLVNLFHCSICWQNLAFIQFVFIHVFVLPVIAYSHWTWLNSKSSKFRRIFMMIFFIIVLMRVCFLERLLRVFNCPNFETMNRILWKCTNI